MQKIHRQDAADVITSTATDKRLPMQLMDTPDGLTQIFHGHNLTSGYIQRDDSDSVIAIMILTNDPVNIGLIETMTPQEALMMAEALTKLADPAYRANMGASARDVPEDEQ